MTTNVNERCIAVATFRHISVQLMETLAGWTPTTPEMEAKVMFGRHIWGHAQMADALGKRTFELRKPLHFTLAPVPAYVALLKQVSAFNDTPDRLAAFYQAIIPGMVARCRQYVDATDPILDEPTVTIMENHARILQRQQMEATGLIEELGFSSTVGQDLARRDQTIGSLVAEAVAP